MQILVNSVVNCALLLLFSISFYVSYRILSIFHFTHAIIISLGAYFVYLAVDFIGMPLYWAFIITILLSAGVGYLTEIGCYQYLRKSQAKSIVYILASLGIYIVLQNFISLLVGDDTKSILPEIVSKSIPLGDARITLVQISIIALTIIIIIALFLFFRYFNLGQMMRFVTNDIELAKISGIDTDRVISWSFAIGSGLGGLAGVLLALDTNITPVMGMRPFMMGIIVVIVGGKNMLGMGLAALLLALSRQYCAYYGRAEWQDAVAFAILVIFLLFKPEGFFGKKVKSATV